MYAIVEIAASSTRSKGHGTPRRQNASGKTDTLAIEKVLMLVDGENVMVGRPYLNNVKVSAAILKK
jgi:ribosomal protein L21